MLALTPVALMLSGCGSAADEKAAVKPAEPMTGLRALYGMYSRARTWADDVKVLHVSSIDIAQVKPLPGKVAAWQAVFASESLGQKRAYVNSSFDASATLRKGIFPEAPSPWSDDKRAFPIAAAKIDTDQAWETALQHGADYAKKNPAMQISYFLEMGRNINDPVWRVIWGESPTSSTFSVLIDASTGLYLNTLF